MRFVAISGRFEMKTSQIFKKKKKIPKSIIIRVSSAGRANTWYPTRCTGVVGGVFAAEPKRLPLSAVRRRISCAGPRGRAARAPSGRRPFRPKTWVARAARRVRPSPSPGPTFAPRKPRVDRFPEEQKRVYVNECHAPATGGLGRSAISLGRARRRIDIVARPRSRVRHARLHALLLSIITHRNGSMARAST